MDLELLEHRGREHQLYCTRCREMGLFPLPEYEGPGPDATVPDNRPQLLIDDCEVRPSA